MMSVTMMPLGGGRRCNESGWPITRQSGGADDSNKRQMATAAVTAGDGSCKGREWQVKAAVQWRLQRQATAAATLGNGKQRQLQRRATALQHLATATLT
jgi:hypothetical protein